jgi:secreted trypsin-like serine protease
MSIRTVCWFSSVLLIGCGGGSEFEPFDLAEAQKHIIGGTTDNGDPAIVALFAHQPNQTSGYLCTGTIITPTKVLTAAHCVDPDVIGTGYVFDVLLGTQLGSGGSLAVSAVAYDPAFDVNNLTAGHDVAVVTLAQATSIAPIPFNTTALGASTNVRIVGYGTSNHTGGGAGTKRTASTTINSFDQQLVHIGRTSRQTCHGDSGGPALQTINGQERVIGITSFGTDLPFFQCFGGGYDTRVDTNTAFINANL